MKKLWCAIALLLPLYVTANQVVTEPWSERDLYESGLAVEVPDSYQSVRRAPRVFLLRSVPEHTRVDIKIMKEAKVLAESVAKFIKNGKKAGWEIYSYDFKKTGFNQLAARIEVRLKAEGEWFRGSVQLANISGKTIMAFITSKEAQYDAKFNERVLMSIQYKDEVLNFKQEGLSFEDLAKDVTS